MEAYQLDTKLSFVNNSIFLSLCVYVYVSLSLCIYLCTWECTCYRYIDSFNGAITVRTHVLAPRMTRERSHVFFLYFFNSIFSLFLSLCSLSFALTHSFKHSFYLLVAKYQLLSPIYWWIKRIKHRWQVNLSWGRILSVT